MFICIRRGWEANSGPVGKGDGAENGRSAKQSLYPVYALRQVHQTLREWAHPSQIIVGSIRHIMDVNEAFQAGADIVTVPPKFFRQMTQHPKTDEAVNQFVTDFQKWLSRG